MVATVSIVAQALVVAVVVTVWLQGVVGRLVDSLPIVTDTSEPTETGPVPFCGLISVPKLTEGILAGTNLQSTILFWYSSV